MPQKTAEVNSRVEPCKESHMMFAVFWEIQNSKYSRKDG